MNPILVRPMLMRCCAPVLAGALGLAACGGDDDAPGNATNATNATIAPAATTTTIAEPTPTTTAGSGAAPAVELGVDPDVDAIVAVVTTVFDSNKSIEEKAPYLSDAEALRATNELYHTTGGQLGGVTVKVTDVAIEGDEATVTYDILFAGNVAYEAITSTVIRPGGAWVMTRDEFCSLMSSARSPCS